MQQGVRVEVRIASKAVALAVVAPLLVEGLLFVCQGRAGEAVVVARARQLSSLLLDLVVGVESLSAATERVLAALVQVQVGGPLVDRLDLVLEGRALCLVLELAQVLLATDFTIVRVVETRPYLLSLLQG